MFAKKETSKNAPKKPLPAKSDSCCGSHATKPSAQSSCAKPAEKSFNKK